MDEVRIVKGADGKFVLDGCPLDYKFPLVCQVKGCPYWRGYMFLNAEYKGMRDYISSSWRRIVMGDVKIANYVRCEHD